MSSLIIVTSREMFSYEDLRGDRQPEFADRPRNDFASERNVQEVMEKLVGRIFHDVLSVECRIDCIHDLRRGDETLRLGQADLRFG